MGDYYDRKKELIYLGELDESEPYEVDYNFIGYDSKANKFVWLTASGCSCWDGDYDEECYDKLTDLFKALKPSEKDYRPTLKGAEAICGEAAENALKLGLIEG